MPPDQIHAMSHPGLERGADLHRGLGQVGQMFVEKMYGDRYDFENRETRSEEDEDNAKTTPEPDETEDPNLPPTSSTENLDDEFHITNEFETSTEPSTEANEETSKEQECADNQQKMLLRKNMPNFGNNRKYLLYSLY